MNRIAYAAAAAALCIAQGAAASPERLDAEVLGIQQQGRGGGKEEGGRGQGGNGRGSSAQGQNRERGGSDSRPAARQQQGGGRSDRASESRGRGGASSGTSGSARGSQGRGSDDNRGSSASNSRGRGRSSDDARGSSGSSGNSGSNHASSIGNRRSGSDDDARGNAGNRGNGAANSNAPSSGAPGRGRLSDDHLRRHIDALPDNVRAFARSPRASERVAAGALARSRARGSDVSLFDVRSRNGSVRILNRRGDLLVDLDDDRARNLGGWEMRRLGDRRPAANAPAFCRSGEGHPVRGREWCLDKGFGLGSRSGTLWSRGGIDDVVWRRRADDRMDRGGLIGVLGDIVFGRLALQAVTLGYDQPLVGFWVAQPEGPRLLRVRSGEYEVAEFVDTNRDDRVDVLYVSQPVYVVQPGW